MNQSIMGVRVALNDIDDPDFQSSHWYFGSLAGP